LHARVATLGHGIPTVGLRFFNVYGPRQDPKSPYSGVISIFCDRISAGEPIAIFGDGGQTRDFVYVADVVAALLAAMATRPATPSTFNVCTGQATSIVDLAHTIGALAGRPPLIAHKPPRTGEIRHSLGDRSAAAHALSLGLPVPPREGLERLLAWRAASPRT